MTVMQLLSVVTLCENYSFRRSQCEIQAPAPSHLSSCYLHIFQCFCWHVPSRICKLRSRVFLRHPAVIPETPINLKCRLGVGDLQFISDLRPTSKQSMLNSVMTKLTAASNGRFICKIGLIRYFLYWDELGCN